VPRKALAWYFGLDRSPRLAKVILRCLDQSYKKLSQGYMEDYLEILVKKREDLGEVTPNTPDEPDVLDAGDGVKGLVGDELATGCRV
jgi:hypothetical protein